MTEAIGDREETKMPERSSAFLQALHATEPAPDRLDNMDLYGWLVGSWDLDVTELGEDGTTRRRRGEWHFDWVLEGRAIQDVWIVPPRGAREGTDAVENRNYYGSTLRVYDPNIDAWHIRWTDPVAQAYLSQIGRRQGALIVQEGQDASSQLRRWTFSEITPASFRWQGEVSADGGATWHLHMEFRAERTEDRRRL